VTSDYLLRLCNIDSTYKCPSRALTLIQATEKVPAISRRTKSLSDHQTIIQTIVSQLEGEESVEGAFLSGSLVNEDRDDFSDVDLGIATKNSLEDFDRGHSLRHQIMAAIGQPLHFLERGWAHCKMVAILYGNSEFPPIGIEVDIIFSQLQHVSEQMPYAEYEVVFDRSGKLKEELDKLPRLKPAQEIEHELRQHMSWCPFYIHDAVKAQKRGDLANFQSLMDEIRKLLFYAATVRNGKTQIGSKRGLKHLLSEEKETVENSYHEFKEGTIRRLVDSYLARLDTLKGHYEITQEFYAFQKSIQEIL